MSEKIARVIGWICLAILGLAFWGLVVIAIQSVRAHATPACEQQYCEESFVCIYPVMPAGSRPRVCEASRECEMRASECFEACLASADALALRLVFQKMELCRTRCAKLLRND
jgi:hypothetical protein